MVASLALAILIVARPARAAATAVAPFCDDRGASAIAPNLTLEATDEAVRRTRLGTCAVNELPALAFVGRATRGLASASDAPGPVLPRPLVLPFFLAGELLDAAPAVLPPSGDIHFRVERPPRH